MKWLAARAAALPPRLQDLVLALALAAVNVGTALPYRSQLHPLAGALALLVLQALPLVWRRRWPVLVFLAVGWPRSLYDQIGFGYAPIPLGPAIAYYTVMERCSTAVRWAVSAVLVTGIFISQALPGHNEPYDFFVAALIFAAAGIAGVLSRTHRAYLDEVEARAARAEAERDQQAALAAARERTAIARELHDVVAHHVSLMAVQAEAADALLPGQPTEAVRSVQVIGQTARQALAELRRLLGVLRGPGELPQTPPSPSLAGLDGVLAQVREAGLAVELTVEGTPGELATGVDLTAYRIVQEALTNALRHSGSARADVSIRYEPGYVTVTVTNSGPDQPGAGTRRGGSALAGRLARLGTAVRTAPAGPGRDGTGPAAIEVLDADMPGHDGAARATAAAAAAADAASARPSLITARSATDPARPSLITARSAAATESGTGGFGLAGIAERVASCGGSLTFGPTQAGGFAVTARLPAL